jgi:hypothetical protein
MTETLLAATDRTARGERTIKRMVGAQGLEPWTR